jgi:hypothetical protein
MKLSEISRLAGLAERAEAQDIKWAGIFSPDFGEREDIPNIILPDGFTAENRNVLLLNGVIERMKMRLPELLEAEFSTGTLTAVNGSATLTSNAAGTWGTSATHKPCWGSDQCATGGRTIKIYDDGGWHRYTIKNVADTGTTLTLTQTYAQTGGAGLNYKISPMSADWWLKFANEGDYLLVTTKSHIEPGTSDFSMTGRCKSSQAETVLLVFEWIKPGPTTLWIYFQINKASEGGQAHFVMSGAGGGASVNAGPNIQDGQEHTIGVSCDRDGYARLYVDGIQVGMENMANLSADNFITATYGPVFCVPPSIGYLDQVRFYKGVILSDEQMAAIHNNGAGIKVISAEIAALSPEAAFYAEFDEGTGNPVGRYYSGTAWSDSAMTLEGNTAWEWGGIRRGTEVGKVKTPDGFPILKYHRLVKTTAGEEYLMVFTKAHAYLWSTAWSAFMLKFTCASDCVMWQTIDFNNQIVATNNVDKIQIWGATVGNAFAALSNASGLNVGAGVYLTAATYMTEYKGYIIVADVVVGGTHYPFYMYWCTKDTETDWDQTGTGDAGDGIITGGGRFRGFGNYSGFLIIAKETQMYHAWLVTTSEVFDHDIDYDNVGCLAPETLINDREGRLYWLASDYTIREWRAGIISQAKAVTVKKINPQYAERAKAGFIDIYNQLNFALPFGSAATGNNVILTFDPPISGLDMSQGKWGELDIDVSAFGDYTRQTVYTWLTWPFVNWPGIGWKSWEGPENVIGFPLDLAADFDGYTYCLHSAETDNGLGYSGHFVLSTDMLIQQALKRYGNALGQYKKLSKIRIFLKRQLSGDFTVEVKRDNEQNYQVVGNVDMFDSENRDVVEGEIDCDSCGLTLRAKHYLAKCGASSRFEFLGIMFGFIPAGAR